MCSLDSHLANHRAWANQRVNDDPDFFSRLARQQAPRFLTILRCAWQQGQRVEVHALVYGLAHEASVNSLG